MYICVYVYISSLFSLAVNCACFIINTYINTHTHRMWRLQDFCFHQEGTEQRPPVPVLLWVCQANQLSPAIQDQPAGLGSCTGGLRDREGNIWGKNSQHSISFDTSSPRTLRVLFYYFLKTDFFNIILRGILQQIEWL